MINREKDLHIYEQVHTKIPISKDIACKDTCYVTLPYMDDIT